ncbi:hypothetical protein [Mycetocola saprophilus]|uniref:hypothetical protein n=1 Tax=Mycetocola saprophilus TaxID=76636 RepID=UPI0004C26853|nr:hypothetical protein [Mycetocola saprophilus]
MTNQNSAADATLGVKAAISNNGRSVAWVAENTGIAYKTLIRRLADPAQFTIRELGQIAAILQVPLPSLIIGSAEASAAA